MAFNKRDRHMIRYLVNHGLYKARFIPTCKYCREANSRRYLTNIYLKFDELRENTWSKFDNLINTLR